MSSFNIKKHTKTIVIFALIVLSLITRIPSVTNSPYLENVSIKYIYALIYFILIVYWGISIQNRIMQKQVLKLLNAIVFLMIFWFMVRSIKYMILISDSDLARYFWYMYYIPMLLIPLKSLFISLSIGKLEDYKLPNWLKIIYIPSIILIIAVLTNDFHQLVFDFSNYGIMSDSNYDYGILYWFVYVWMITPLLFSLIIIIFKSRVPRSKKFVLLPFLVYFVGIIYGILVILKIPILHSVLGDITAVFCLFIMAIYESLIQSGFIRSNRFYKELFFESDLRAEIIGDDNVIYYQTLLMQDKSNDGMRLSEHNISNGKISWWENVSEINKMISRLEEINSRLSEENNLLNAEVELKERQIKIDEKNRLYDNILQKLKPQLTELNENIIELLDYESIDYKLVHICVLGTYIKRISNLLILYEDNDYLSAKELEFSLQESIEVISKNSINASLKTDTSGYLKASDIILIYEFFEEIIETTFYELTDLFINLKSFNGNLFLKILLETNNPLNKSLYDLKTALEIKEKGIINITFNNNSTIIDIKLEGDDI